MTKEKNRLEQNRSQKANWKKWGPYLSERQWGTVREDYSADGNAWDSVTYEMALSKAYRWGEDGIAGISDDRQLLCFSVALWNGKDPVIKERLFGLTGPQGNHGEDVKEYYYYLDNVPTHSYMKYLYKYPQSEFPYRKLIEENKKRSKEQPEYELADTGIFNDNKYFDVFIEYAKIAPEDILIKITVVNQSDEISGLTLLPQIWFRNIWSWDDKCAKPQMRLVKENQININHNKLGKYYLHFEDQTEILFCENETNTKKLYGVNSDKKYLKDGINEFIVHGKRNAVNPKQKGTKAAVSYDLQIPPNGEKIIKLRLSENDLSVPFRNFQKHIDKEKTNADEFYAEIQKDITSEDEKNVQRQAFAGLLWSKQFYYYDIPEWLNGDPDQPKPPESRKKGRNSDWEHLNNADIISMPDKWEYPWFAVWDSAFHAIPFSIIDAEFAKEQLLLFTREWYMHPNGQLPAYEWNFSDVNPPVHAWAAWRVYKIDKKYNGAGDLDFLERIFHKLLINFTWWVNKKDEDGRNIFQGGFLGMDNIGIFDRSTELPIGGHIDQSDGTSWMAMYSLNLMRIALELSLTKPIYQDLATKFFEHFLYIASAMTNIAGEGIGLWDEEDEFYYDALHLPNGKHIKLKIRSMVGLIPLLAVEVLEPELLNRLPEFNIRLKWFLKYRPDLAGLVSHWDVKGKGKRRLLSLLRGHRMKKLLKRMLDETEFLSGFGIRSLSKYHRDNPYILKLNGNKYEIKYLPAESDSGMFGGNSNWRGPVWFPVNYLLIEALQRFHHYYGDDFKVEYPTNSATYLTINEIANELSKRLIKIFLKDDNWNRPVFGKNNSFQKDPDFKNYILFYEYFNGDTGEGLGASHQTGWTALVAKLLQPRAKCN